MDLHTACYEKILAGEGFGLSETENAIDLVYQIRNYEEAVIVGRDNRSTKSANGASKRVRPALTIKRSIGNSGSNNK